VTSGKHCAFVLALTVVSAAVAGERTKAPEMCFADERASLTNFGPDDDARKGAASGSKPVARECLIDAPELLASPSRPTLVDIRPPASYTNAWIPGSANLGIELLANNALVRTSVSVVLVGDGKDTARLLHRCSLLHESGLSQIRVLDGGLPAWLRAGGSLAGNVASIDQPLVLGEGELYEVLHQPGAILVFGEGRPTAALTESAARIVQAKGANASPKLLLRSIPIAVAKRAAAVVFLSSAREIPAWRTTARSMSLPEPLFFVGGASRYDAYLEQEARIAAAAKKPRQSTCDRG